MCGVFYTDYNIPGNLVPIEEVLKGDPDFKIPETYESVDDFSRDFREEGNLDTIAIGGRDEALEIFSGMVSRFFEEKGVSPEDIGCIIYIDLYGNTRGYISIPHYLKEKFHMEKAVIFYLHQGCTSVLMAMDIGKKFLDAGSKYVMILTSCFVSDIRYRYLGSTILGDALGMMVLSRESADFDIVDFISVSDGTPSCDRVNDNFQEQDSLTIVRKGVRVIKKLLEKNGMDITQIHRMVPQSINHQIYNFLFTKFLGLPEERMFLDNIPSGGHLGAVDTIRNFKDCMAKNAPVHAGAYILLYGAGGGGPEGKDVDYSALLLRHK